MSNGGFDPDRINFSRRERPVIPQILSPDAHRLARGFTEIKVVGVGGAGSNTVDRMIEADVQGIDFIAVNSDAQALERTLARTRVHLGGRLSQGLGAGGDAKLGERMADMARGDLEEALGNADMVFVTAGLGGGTGTGAAPVIAEVARQAGALTVGVITLPFSFEGARRRATAAAGLDRLKPIVDCIIVIANDRLLQSAPPNTGINHAFRIADDTLNQGIRGVADLVLTPGLINLDYADVYSVMHRSGSALMAMGRATGENRARLAAEMAVETPLADASIDGAHAVLLNITGGPDLSLYEVNEAAQYITRRVGSDCNIIFGAVIHPRVVDEVRITVIATGFNRE